MKCLFKNIWNNKLRWFPHLSNNRFIWSDQIYNKDVSDRFNGNRVAIFQPIVSYQNQLVSYLDNYSLYEEVAGTGFVKAPSAIEHHLQNEGAILISYTMHLL